jgi:oxalate decarboxylase/phosphoglucose isomerase-like protein (cupin superfamily)
MSDRERFFINSDDVETLVYDWGQGSMTISPQACGAKTFSAGIVTVLPGGGHARHNHPGAEEIIHVIAGYGEQMVEDAQGRPVTHQVGPGTSIFVPESRYHATLNTSKDPMTLYVVYSPAGPEELLKEIPGVEIRPAKRPW